VFKEVNGTTVRAESNGPIVALFDRLQRDRGGWNRWPAQRQRRSAPMRT
jgi:hypothetical protein